MEMQECTFKPAITSTKPSKNIKPKIVLRQPLRPRNINKQTNTN